MTQNDPAFLRGALIGYGFIASQGHMPAYLERGKKQQDVMISAVADICESRRELVKKMLPLARIYPDYESLLRGEAGKLDFIDICTPPCDHARIAHEALDLGLHVLCEKPLTTTVLEAKSMLEHAARVKRVLFPCHNYKHAPVVKAIREIIESGQIGRVRSVTLNTFRNTHAKGVNEWNTHWRRDKHISGGGIAMDHGSHAFYLTFDWLGSYPTSVTARMANLEPEKYDTEDNFTAVLSFPTGMAHIHLTWTAGIRKVIYTIQGEKGGITIDDDQLELALMEKARIEDVAQGAVKWSVKKSTIKSHWMDASHVSWFNSLFGQFKTAIEQKDYAGKEIRESVLCNRIITAAYRSCTERSREISLEAQSG